MDKMLLTPAEVSELIGVPVETLRFWRHKGTTGPPAFKLGPKKVRYHRDDLDAWVAEQRGVAAGGGAAGR